MRDRTLKWLLAAAMGLLLPCSASAAGLGRLIVHSALGQPLNAEVERATQNPARATASWTALGARRR